jgi:hypothetical protein
MAVKGKNNKYAPVVYTAMLQRYQRGSKRKVVFAAAALAHSGEMSSGSGFVGHWKRAARKGGPLYDGHPLGRVAADFKKNLIAIQVTAVRTIGHYIAATGL